MYWLATRSGAELELRFQSRLRSLYNLWLYEKLMWQNKCLPSLIFTDITAIIFVVACGNFDIQGDKETVSTHKASVKVHGLQ